MRTTLQKSFTTAIACVLLLSCAMAAAGGPALVIRDDGYYLLDPKSTQLTKLAVVDQRTGATPPPVDQPPPDQAPPASTNANRVKELAKKINDPAGAEVLAASIGMIRENGSVPPSAFEGSNNVFSATFGVILVQYERESPGAKKRWQPFRTEFAELISELRSKGELSTQEQCNRFLADAEAGLRAATGGAALSPEILEFIRTLLPFILEIIRMFGGLGAG